MSRRALIVLVLLVLAAGGITLGVRLTGKQPVAGKKPPSSSPTSRSATAPLATHARLESGGGIDGLVGDRPMITDVTIEPANPCVGDMVMATVALNPYDGMADDLLVSVNHERGNPVAVVVQEPDLALNVEVADQRGHYHRRFFQVPRRMCTPAERALAIRTMSAGEHEVLAFRLDGLDAPDGWQVQWDFGDGHVVDGGRYIEHDFSDREQTALQSSLTIRATVRKGDVVRHAVGSAAFLNNYYINRKQNGVIVPVVVAGTPVHEGNSYSVPLLIHHGEAGPLTVSKVAVRAVACEGEGKDMQPLPLTALSPTSWAASSTAVVHIPEEWLIGACGMAIELEGSGPDGTHMYALPGAFISDQGQAPTRELDPEHNAADRAHIERVKKAMRLLGRDPYSGEPITEGDIDRLVREGKLPPE